MTSEQRKHIWVDALRSDKYTQTRYTLRSDKGYCCLGVYAEIVLGISPFVCVRDEEGNLYEGDLSIYDSISAEVPPSVYYKAIVMNDSGESFESIANMIEEHW